MVEGLKLAQIITICKKKNPLSNKMDNTDLKTDICHILCNMEIGNALLYGVYVEWGYCHRTI